MTQDVVVVNPDGYLLTRADGSQSLLLHHELQSIEILNDEQVYLLLQGPQVSLVIHQESAGRDELLQHMQKLPGFDNQAFIQSMSESGKFLCWKRPELPSAQPG